MLAKELISDLVTALRTSDSGSKALSWMEIFRVSHLPIVNENEFLGLISDTDIYDFNMADETIGNHHLSFFRPFVRASQHIYEVIELASQQKLSIIPVLDDQNNYLGSITLHDLVQYFAKITAVESPGGIIVLEMNITDYYLGEIARIVEGNDAKILSLYVDSSNETTKINVTLKINRDDLSPVIQTFNRYNYDIKAVYTKQNQMEDLVQDHYESLVKYLNI